MTRKACFIVAAVFSGGLLSGWASAQTFRPSQRIDPPVVLSGSDVGFRVEARRGSTPIGHLVVRIDGQWRDADFPSGPSKLGTQ
jgi:hypothetical protein